MTTGTGQRYGTFLALTVLLVALVWACVPPVVVSAASYPCSEAGVDAALAAGGTATFSCAGATTITVSATKTATKNATLDGGGRVTLSGGGARRVLTVNSGIAVGLVNLTFRDGAGGGL